MSTPKFNRKLAERLHFTAEDLAANHQGNVSDSQIPLLRRKRRQNLVFNGFFVLFFGAVGLALFTVLLAGDIAVQSKLCAGSLIVGFALAALVFVNESVRFWGNIRKDIEGGIIEAIDGRVVLKMSGAYGKVRYMTYSLRVNHVLFNIDEAAFRCFKDLEHYRVYYTLNARVILSAEPIEGD